MHILIAYIEYLLIYLEIQIDTKMRKQVEVSDQQT